jgi:hypothetical protein
MSGHRTLDPGEADFFYVPQLLTCWMHPVSGELAAAATGRASGAATEADGWATHRCHATGFGLRVQLVLGCTCFARTRLQQHFACARLAPVLTSPLNATTTTRPPGWADYPWWYVDSWSRVSHAVMMTHELLTWVKTAHPYWNRTGGADHIWLFAHDEGACWAPTEVYQNSIILTHWGRLDPDHASGTSYGPVGCLLSALRLWAECVLLIWQQLPPCALLAEDALHETAQVNSLENRLTPCLALHPLRSARVCRTRWHVNPSTSNQTIPPTNQPSNQSTSAPQDNYTADVLDDPFNPKGFVRLIRGHACYTPGKDLVIPLFRGADRWGGCVGAVARNDCTNPLVRDVCGNSWPSNGRKRVQLLVNAFKGAGSVELTTRALRGRVCPVFSGVCCFPPCAR